MANRRWALVSWMGALSLACSAPGGDDSSAGDGNTNGTTEAPPGSTGPATSGNEGTGQVETGGTGGTSTPADTSGGEAPADTGPPPVYFDLGGIPDSPMFCTEGDGEVQFSYIWIANSTQGTISKINTETLVEEGRYQTRPDTSGSPSRTSVSLTGNVAVANRSGGLTKFYADHANCPDDNGNGIVDTSNDNQWEPWGDEECMAWHTPMAYTSQRPVAWTQGEFDKAACATVNEKVWTSGANGENIEVLLVDGDTGVIEETIPVPGVPANYYGIYGAAVDSEGNFWGSQLGGGTLVHVNLQTFDLETWSQPSGYGMTVDHEGYVWTCDYMASRFDPMTETWQQANVGASGGCMSDGGDILWMAGSPMRGINRQTLAVEYSIPLPGSVHGVSIDYQGYVWGVDMSNSAYRVDPDAGTWDVVTGLVNPYTYSDMTGFALNNVGGGGAPSG
jgi:hypothetical protein